MAFQIFWSEHGFTEHCVAPYLDTHDMAAKILAFIDSKSLRQEIGEQLRQMAIEVFDMEHYTAQLEEFGLASSKRIAQERLDAFRNCQIGACLDGISPESACFLICSRHPMKCIVIMSAAGPVEYGAGSCFQDSIPGYFLRKVECAREKRIHWQRILRAGNPDGPWRYEVLSSEETKSSIPSGTRIALHIHAYYPDLLPDMLARLNRNRVRPDLFVSVPTKPASAEVEKSLKTYPGKVVELQVVPNRGRDIAPFLTAFGSRFVDHYDLRRSFAYKENRKYPG